MEQERPILSIVIPSRNRAKYAISCIQSILGIKDNRIEIVVHDNSDTNELEQFITKNINDKRLIYCYDSTLMSTVDNFNNAMNYVHGEYICFIGDDDGINPEIIDAAIWAKKKNIDVLVSKILMGYNWPNDSHSGNFHIYPFSGRWISVNVENELKGFLSDGGVHYLEYNLPKIYHGVVRKECFDKVKDKIGYYFGGLSVDIFSSIAISLVAQNVVAIDYPLTIAGSSPASNQTHRTEEAKKIDLKNAPHLRGMRNYVWSERVPSVYAVATIWAESGIKALEEFKREDLLKIVDKFKLTALVAIDSPQHEKTILHSFLTKNSSPIITLKYNYIKSIIRLCAIVKKIVNRVGKIIGLRKTSFFTNVVTISDASRLFQNFLIEKSLNIKKYLLV